MKKLVCQHCGSDTFNEVRAEVMWDKLAQEWAVTHIYEHSGDESMCHTCGKRGRLTWIAPIKPPEPVPERIVTAKVHDPERGAPAIRVGGEESYLKGLDKEYIVIPSGDLLDDEQWNTILYDKENDVTFRAQSMDFDFN